MHAATVDLMMKKAHFETDTAMAVAEAFDIAIQHAQLVTVPMLDVRLGQLDARFAQFATKSEMDTRFAEMRLYVDDRFVEMRRYIDDQFAKIDARFLALEARVGNIESKMEILFALQEERLDKKLEALKAEVVRWVFLVMLGNAAISAAVNALMNSLPHLR